MKIRSLKNAKNIQKNRKNMYNWTYAITKIKRECRKRKILLVGSDNEGIRNDYDR